MQHVGPKIAAAALGLIALSACSAPPIAPVEVSAAVSARPSSEIVAAPQPPPPTRVELPPPAPSPQALSLELERPPIRLEPRAICRTALPDGQLDSRLLGAAAGRLDQGRRPMDLLDNALHLP